ncbi:MAG TPA: PD-(D/E)XK nuclease family protein [Solirubrobacteraceae bacterium]|jgi:ATP-dependent helicase/DNAse subunit B|nr:PD-(D/E)XK nuclease family protein [Solirubrobacteraceae bacterium]
MPLTLVLGPANSAKAAEVLGAYRASARRGAILVVPTRLDREHYRREVLAEGALLGGEVLTFPGLAREIARRAGYGGRTLSLLQRERALRATIRCSQLTAIGASASSPGFAPAVGALIAELERALVTPQRFAQALRSWAGEDAERSAYAGEVASLYREYTHELERLGRVDAELFAWRALDALRAAPGRWGSTPVYLYGFDDLTPLERDAIETVARVAGAEVTVSLTYEPGRAAFTGRAEAVEELRPLADRVLDLPASSEHYAPASRRALHHLERGLFEPVPSPSADSPTSSAGAELAPHGRVDPGDAVRLLESGGERAEAELVAAHVAERLRAGVPADEIAVVLRSLRSSGALFERVLAAYGVPVACPLSVPFEHTPLGRGLLALARCALRPPDPGAQALVSYLRTPGMLARRELADALEATIRRTGVRTAAGAQEAAAALGLRLEEIESLREARDPVSELARHARRLFAAPRRGQAATLDAVEEVDARALATVLGALGELGELGDSLSSQELIETLAALEVPGRTSASGGAVLLAEPLAIRARRFRAVFVCGLQDGEFPRPPVPEPFLSDERRWELATASGLRLRPREDAVATERYLFYACVSRATESLVLSYRSSDEEGNIAVRSPFVADVAELLVPEWEERRARRLLADVVWPSAVAPTPRELARAQAADGPRIPEPALAPLGPAAFTRMRHRQVVSAGALESYASCPVKWLVERELRPRRFEPDPDGIARGNYVHAVLERVFARLGGAITETTGGRAQELLDEVLAQEPARLATGRSAAEGAALLREIDADLRRYLEQEAASGWGWSPRHVELRFGFEDDSAQSLPALELEGGLRVRGAIDRVDVDPAGRRAIIRDYKSGRVNQGWAVARWREDRSLQVALYMLAVRDLLELDPVAGLYQPLGGEDLRPRGLVASDAPVADCVYENDRRDPDELRLELADAAERAVAIAERLRTGGLEPCPQTCSGSGCLYPGICRTE